MASTGASIAAFTSGQQNEAQSLNALVAQGRDADILRERERLRRKEVQRVGMFELACHHLCCYSLRLLHAPKSFFYVVPFSGPFCLFYPIRLFLVKWLNLGVGEGSGLIYGC